MSDNRLISNLTRRAEFLAAASSGFKYVKPSVIVQARRRKDSEPSPTAVRIGFTATKRLGGAVVRNRVKRRLKAAVSQILPGLGVAECDYVFIGREATFKGTFDTLIRDLKHALKRLASQLEGPGSQTPEP